jgi:hypothetical protein
MRRFFTALAATAMCLAGIPAAAQAQAAQPIGSGAVLFNPLGPANRQCTAAFAATDGDNAYLIAGPTCTGGDLYTTTAAGTALVGTVAATALPYNGWAIVKVTDTTDWQLVPGVPDGKTRLPVNGSKETPVGGKVCHVGERFGQRCGTVEATGLTVSFSWGTATGVTRTSICTGSRDLGAAYLTDDQAQGIPLGGPDFCTGTGAGYFVPVNPILDKYGLKLVTG